LDHPVYYHFKGYFRFLGVRWLLCKGFEADLLQAVSGASQQCQCKICEALHNSCMNSSSLDDDNYLNGWIQQFTCWNVYKISSALSVSLDTCARPEPCITMVICQELNWCCLCCVLPELVDSMKQQRQPNGATESIGPVLVDWVLYEVCCFMKQ